MLYVLALANEWWKDVSEYRFQIKMILLLFTVVMFSLVYWSFADQRNWNDNLKRDRLTYMDTLYFSTITASTIGFGDITPRTTSLRWLVILQVFLSFGIVII